jgi:hypothetical protein
MAFTAGSVELAKATKLANQLSELYQKFGSTNMSGLTAAMIVEQYAERLGFGITGLTTGAGFPPFGTILPSNRLGVAAALQNPRGETAANNIILGAVAGATVGIYMKKFVRSGADYSAVMASGVTLALGYTSGGANNFWARGPISVQTNDLIQFSDATYVVAPNGTTSAGSGGTAAFRVLGTVSSTYATGAAFNVATVGVTRGTSGVAGATFENYARNTVVNAGFTAAIFFGGATGSTGSIA